MALIGESEIEDWVFQLPQDEYIAWVEKWLERRYREMLEMEMSLGAMDGNDSSY